MAITIPTQRDDAGLQRLQKANTTRLAGAVMPAGESPLADHRADEDAPLPAPRAREQRAPQGNRRHQDRRHGERRRADTPVLLDTRHRQERRRQWRRQADEAALAVASPLTGIDIFV